MHTPYTGYIVEGGMQHEEIERKNKEMGTFLA